MEGSAMRAYLRPGTWAAMLAAALVCLLLGSPTTGAAPTAQPNPKPILLTDPVPDPRQDGVVYFPQTGHTLRGPFLRYWQEHGALAQFGYPLTEEFFEPSGPDNAPLQVQYFERNRFELHPDNAGTPHEVLLGTLGREFRTQDLTAQQQPDALYFPETGHNLSGKFREYWEAHGGLAIHGYPITEVALERSTNGKDYLVQWFERSRFELHPENAGSEHEVLLGLLGGQLSEKKGYPFGWYPPYGRAVDWSWVAGHLYPQPRCIDPICSCSVFGYSIQGNTEVVYLSGITSRYRDPRMQPLLTLLSAVIFGHLAGPNEQNAACEPNMRGYVLERSQPNPAR
jgi:hypothetical protein